MSEFNYFMLICILVISVVLYLWNNHRFIDTLISRNDTLNKDISNLRNEFNKSQQIQIDQINELSDKIIELHNTIDIKLKSQSDEFKNDLGKVNSRMDTILGIVLECDNGECPTKKKISNYLKNQ
jgi:hypothetical protein